MQLQVSRNYRDTLAEEVRVYEHCSDVHSLPGIFHYWTNRHILPELSKFGFRNPAAMFVRYLAERCAATTPARFVSFGAGNCDLELALARELRALGHEDFVIECIDLNPPMLERGRHTALAAGLDGHMSFTEADLNLWSPAGEYDAAIANQALHHVLNLENLFDQTRRALLPGAPLLVSDMVGRNGHQRWPEALAVVHEFWRQLPPSHRWNHKSGCYEELYVNWDCSGEGFEGVRAQDILPLLGDRFRFRFFFPFGNAIDPFVDRAFGPNFDAANAWDRDFIDRVHERDRVDIGAGRLSPTHMLAVLFREDGALTCPPDLTPEFCIHKPQAVAYAAAAPPLYQWDAWPHTDRSQLETACARLTESAASIGKQTAWAEALDAENQGRLEWARKLEADLDEQSRWAQDLKREVAERIAWSVGLAAELEARTAWAQRLNGELIEQGLLQKKIAELEGLLEERTAWALRLDGELEEKTAWCEELQVRSEAQARETRMVADELRGYVHNPWRYARRLLAGLWRRWRGQSQ